MMPEHPVALDALLMAAWATREDLPPLDLRDGATIAIPDDAVPLARSACGRIYLASVAQFEAEEHERRWLNRRFPMAEAQMLGGASMRRVNASAGLTKGSRIPQGVVHLRGDVMIWYALGKADAVRQLLEPVQYVGKKRSVGLGRVVRWDVHECEPWDGFPVLDCEGRPLRSLPLDWPGLGAHCVEERVLTPPYWERWRAEACAV
jgi:CRISPR type IV-associated protein Csf3